MDKPFDCFQCETPLPLREGWDHLGAEARCPGCGTEWRTVYEENYDGGYFSMDRLPPDDSTLPAEPEPRP